MQSSNDAGATAESLHHSIRANPRVVCSVGEHLKGLGWDCAVERRNFMEWRSTKDGSRKIKYLRMAFSDTPSFDLPTAVDAMICTECSDMFTLKPGTSCKSENHPVCRKRGPLDLKKGHYITAKEFLSIYRELDSNLKPNTICCVSCIKPIGESQPQDVDEEFVPPPTKKALLESFNSAVQHIQGASPISLSKQNVKAQGKSVDKAIQGIDESLRNAFRQQGLNISQVTEDSKLKRLEQDSEDLNNLMQMLKHRIQDCPKAEQQSLLTVCPPSWSHKAASEFFEVPISLIRSSRKLAREACCILPPPKTQGGKKLPLETKAAVLEFYNQDDVSRACPGLRDVVSVKDPVTGKREKKQKKFLVNNLNELYQQFKQKNPTLKIGVSSFVSLRPQEMKSYYTKGQHNVCLCVYHENVKLLFNAIKEPSIKVHISRMVCDISNKDCMYLRCNTCCDKKLTEKSDISSLISKLEFDVVKYRRWNSTDGMSYEQEEKPADEFAEFIVKELETLLRHHYLSQAQHEYFKTTKNSLKAGELLIWGDFSENYSVVIQNEVQSNYFCQKHVTLHPFNVYLRHNEQLYSFAFCIISDCLTHNTNTVFAFQHALIQEINRQMNCLDIENTEHIFYFSDGSAAQYKNRKNFSNIFYHKKDFKITAEWNFFPTAHGKGPPDAHGGTTKRMARAASLQGASISNAEELFMWCKKNVHQIEYIFVSKEQVEAIVELFDLSQRYNQLKIITGTQQAHCVRVDNEKVILYETSKDTQCLTSRIVGEEIESIIVPIDESSVDDWIAGAYFDGLWYPGKIEEVDILNKEVLVLWYKGTMKRGTTFKPEGTKTWLPNSRILMRIPTPNISKSGRTVTIPLSLQDEFDVTLERIIGKL